VGCPRRDGITKDPASTDGGRESLLLGSLLVQAETYMLRTGLSPMRDSLTVPGWIWAS